MPQARLSGTISSKADPNRETRARILYELFANGWDIQNSNGNERITLSNIEEKILESDAFVFMPGASLEDLFKAVSIYVGYQTLDPNLKGKATAILNTDKSWDRLFDLLDDLQRLGTIKQSYRKFLLLADQVEEIVPLLEKVRVEGVPDIGRKKIVSSTTGSFDTEPAHDLDGNVCVFCSATIKAEEYLKDGYRLGQLIAQNNLGCVSGAGTTGVMGAVVRGSVDAGGWTGGSNVPHIIELEGLPNGLSSFWLRPDIYTRMEVMIQHSDAFVIFPGGAGTVQEVLALLIFKQMDHSLMHGKPIIIFNRPVEGTEAKFWDKLIELLKPWNAQSLFKVVDRLDEIIPSLKDLLLERRAL